MSGPSASSAPVTSRLSAPAGHTVPGTVAGGPKPVVYRGLVLNSKLTVFYTLLFVVPSVAAFAWTGGKTQLSKEELLESEAAKAKLRSNYGPEDEDRLKERKAMMQKVLFETKADMRQDWAIKRDEERARKKALAEQQKAQ